MGLLYESIFSFENLHQAYLEARKGKRYRRDVLEFTHNLEENLITLQNELIWQAYQVGRYREFYVYEPKQRLVMALPFRDRVVQWAVYRQLNPILDKTYISHTFACRVGFGAHKAVKKVQYWLRKMHRQCSQVYVLKMDVAKYFYRVDHDVLMDLLREKIQDAKVINLLETIIRCEHTTFGIDLGTGLKVGGVGMPIGNLTSQMFANFYLNQLDRHCKHDLKAVRYIRYMDDVLVVSHSKEYLKMVWLDTDLFLQNRLRLRLNGKTCIRGITQGVEFCGYRIWPEKIKLKKKTALRMRRAVRGIVKGRPVSAMSSLQSYKGLARHASGAGLQKIINCAIVNLQC